MVGYWHALSSLLCALFVSANTAHAFCSLVGYGYGYVLPASSFYYYAPAYYYYPHVIPETYCAPTPRVVPLENPRGKFADPIPAPPSPKPQTPAAVMPPARTQNNPDNNDKRAPMVITIRSRTGGYLAGDHAPSKDVCRVGFWNLSGRELTLTVAEKSWKLPKDQSITLDLDRSFAWQVDQRPQSVERVPEGQSAHELVIRE